MHNMNITTKKYYMDILTVQLTKEWTNTHNNITIIVTVYDLTLLF